MSFTIKTNAPNFSKPKNCNTEKEAIKAFNSIPNGWQVSISYGNKQEEIYYGMKGLSDPPTISGLSYNAKKLALQ